MQIALAAHMPFRRSRPDHAPKRQASHPADPAMTRTQRARRGEGPQDRALYACGCGCAFTAPVSTTVGCPHCGTSQAW